MINLRFRLRFDDSRIRLKNVNRVFAAANRRFLFSAGNASSKAIRKQLGRANKRFTSKPGNTPVPKVTGNRGLRFTRFKVNLNREEVDVGPALYPSRSSLGRRIPGIHEFGGRSYNKLYNRVQNNPKRPFVFKAVRIQSRQFPRLWAKAWNRASARRL